MDGQKKVYVRHGEVLKIECLQDAVTGENYFLIKSDQGITVKADKIVMLGAGTIFTADEKERMFSLGSLHDQIYLIIKEFVKDGRWGMEKGTLGNYGEVNYAVVKNLVTFINGALGDSPFRGINSRTISKICKELGFRFARLGAGYAIVLEDEDLLAIGKRFEVSPQAETLSAETAQSPRSNLMPPL